LDGLFQPFSQADSSTTRKFGGSGLGLSIVGNLAKAMGGDVGVTSHPGMGSRFWFRVRVNIVQDAAGHQSLLPDGHASPHTTLQGHVLVVEDNSVNAMVVQALLEKLGITSTLVTDGQQAVDAMTQPASGHDFSLILMDLQMPRIDGYAATEKIRQSETRQQRQRIPIIALTADAFEEDRQRCQTVGMDDFVTKPIAIDALKTAMEKWLPQTAATTSSARTATPVASKPLDLAAFDLLVSELTPLLAQNKFAAMAGFKKLQALTQATALEADLNALDELLRNMRFDQVLAQLQTIAAAQHRPDTPNPSPLP
jgi:CheY-like chemotaxis protein